jgi:transcriptional regulator with XRE-family HTH domain
VEQDRVQVGQALRETRRYAGLTQMELARHIGISQSTVSRVERGVLDPSDEFLSWANDTLENLTNPHGICTIEKLVR